MFLPGFGHLRDWQEGEVGCPGQGRMGVFQVLQVKEQFPGSICPPLTMQAWQMLPIKMCTGTALILPSILSWSGISGASFVYA